jgi:hypothetical protein
MKFIYMTYAAEEISKLNIIRPKHGFLVKVRFSRATAILCMIVNTQQRTDKYQERYQGCIWTLGGGGGLALEGNVKINKKVIKGKKNQG